MLIKSPGLFSVEGRNTVYGSVALFFLVFFGLVLVVNKPEREVPKPFTFPYTLYFSLKTFIYAFGIDLNLDWCVSELD